MRQAEELLSEAQVRDGLRLDADAIAALKACCSLRPPRNAAAIVAAIKARLEYSQPKPVQKLEHAGVDGAPLSITFAQARRDPT